VTLGLVMDLARRMAQANSSLSAGGHHIVNPLDLPAIVLIDEVDLHLHPKWQQIILTDLMRTFSSVQFIVTTHSPQVLSTVRRENIRVISQDVAGKALAVPPIAMTYGEPSGDVMHSVMQVDPQPPVIEREALQRLTEWVDQGQFGTADARRLQQELTTKLGEQHPQLQRLQRSIRRQLALNA
jgi:predicted ATP-binding protein involved in virulence